MSRYPARHIYVALAGVEMGRMRISKNVPYEFSIGVAVPRIEKQLVCSTAVGEHDEESGMGQGQTIGHDASSLQASDSALKLWYCCCATYLVHRGSGTGVKVAWSMLFTAPREI